MSTVLTAAVVLTLFAPSVAAQDTTGVPDAELLQDVTFLTGGYPAYLVVRLHHGGFETPWSDELTALLASLARPIAR